MALWTAYKPTKSIEVHIWSIRRRKHQQSLTGRERGWAHCSAAGLECSHVECVFIHHPAVWCQRPDRNKPPCVSALPVFTRAHFFADTVLWCMLLLLSFILRSCCWTAVENLQSFQSFCLYWKKIKIISREFHQYFYMIWLKLSSFKTACLSKQKINLQIIIFNGLLIASNRMIFIRDNLKLGNINLREIIMRVTVQFKMWAGKGAHSSGSVFPGSNSKQQIY